ncbi:MAG: methyltransferase domain-containing protein [Candidatus Kapaibacteriota bacterium]|jgi:2-polyprenyl-3-methyl-5-hydroxy-6-metoxy-1,4-benzoquinol methylase
MYNLFQLLVSPGKKLPLYFNKTNETLVCGEGEFQILDGIPILLPKQKTNYIEHYQKDAELFDYFEPRLKETESEEERLAQYILWRIPPKAKLIADVGCGKGWLARRLLRLDRIVVSIDLSYTNVSKVLKLYPDENHFGVVADGYNLPFKDEAFDCVVASEVIEHLESPNSFISELVRIVKQNGKIIITTPYREKIRYTLCVHCNKPTPWNAHLHSFDEFSLNQILTNSSPLIHWRFYKFGNSLIQYLRLYRALKLLPFWLWRLLDSFLNLFSKPKHILVEITKE